MDCPLSETVKAFDALEKAVRAGSWQSAANVAGKLCALPPPTDSEGARQYLDRLREILIAARAARAHSLTLLSRVRAAARFYPPSVHISER